MVTYMVFRLLCCYLAPCDLLTAGRATMLSIFCIRPLCIHMDVDLAKFAVFNVQTSSSSSLNHSYILMLSLMIEQLNNNWMLWCNLAGSWARLNPSWSSRERYSNISVHREETDLLFIRVWWLADYFPKCPTVVLVWNSSVIVGNLLHSSMTFYRRYAGRMCGRLNWRSKQYRHMKRGLTWTSGSDQVQFTIKTLQRCKDC